MAAFLVNTREIRIAPAVAADLPSVRTTGRTTTWSLLLLTLLGGALRFFAAYRVPIWYDEAQTFRRISGSFLDLTHALQSDGFMPLHYWLEWLVCRAVGGPLHLTPFWLRFTGAICGTMMIPAMYALARQFCGRRTALVVAAFTCCSAYMNAYSRDAKMYMPLWLFVTLSVTLMLVWARNGRVWPWAGWVICSVLMVGFHPGALGVLAVQPLAFALWHKPGHPNRVGAMVAGLLIVIAGPVVYYGAVTHWAGNVKEKGWAGASGLAWVPHYNQGRSRCQLLAYAASAYGTGWEWPGGSFAAAPQSNDPHVFGPAACQGAYVPAAVGESLKIINLLLLGLVIAGGSWGVLSLARKPDGSPDPGWWRSSLFLGVWLVAPVAVFYQIATHPWSSTAGLAHRVWIGAVLAAAAVIVLVVLPVLARRTRQGTDVFSQALLLLIFVSGFSLAVSIAARAAHVPVPGWAGIWVPRYMGVVWPAFAVILCSLLMLLPGAAMRRGAIALLLCVNAVQSVAAAVVPARPPMTRIAHDMWLGCFEDGALRTYVPKAPPAPELLGDNIFLGSGKYDLIMESGRVLSPTRWLGTPAELIVPLHPSDDPAQIAADLARHPAVRRIVVWDVLVSAKNLDLNTLGRVLPGHWRLVGEERFSVRYLWNWSDFYTARRCEYVRDRE